jgi:[histone H3]-lysine4 N-trimethyltransferase SETD1
VPCSRVIHSGHQFFLRQVVCGRGKRVFQGCHMHPLFTYVMNMELNLNGNPKNITSTATTQAPVDYVVQKQNYRLKKEHEADLEEEKRQRAKDLDPCRAVLQMVIQEVRDKLIEDVKSRIAAPALYEYLEPSRHAEKRRRLGVEEPESERRKVYGLDDWSSVGTPNSRTGFMVGRKLE